MDEVGGTRRDKKRQAILAIARDAFVQHGYAGTTMSFIAAELGGSKGTLWAYFPSKENLFAAVVDAMAERFGEALRLPLPITNTPSVTLRLLAQSIMKTLLTPQILALHQMVLGESCRYPELGRLFIEHGPGRGHAHVGRWFGELMDHGLMRRADPVIAAQHFLALCEVGCIQQARLGLRKRFTQAERDADVDRALMVFQGGYALK